MNQNPFGQNPFGKDSFGPRKASKSGSPFSGPPAAASPAISTAPAGRRRVVSEEEAPVAGAPVPEIENERAYVSGEHFCYLYKVGTTKAGAHFFELRLVGGVVDGTRVTVWQVAKNVMQAKELREMYIHSGYPESKWKRDMYGKPMQPVPSMFMRSLGGGVWVPILMIGLFELRPNPKDSLAPFQKIVSIRPVVSRYTDGDGQQESFIIAPLPNLLPTEVARAYGFAGICYDWGGMMPTTMEMVQIDSVFEIENEFTRLDGTSTKKIDLDNPREVVE